MLLDRLFLGARALCGMSETVTPRSVCSKVVPCVPIYVSSGDVVYKKGAMGLRCATVGDGVVGARNGGDYSVFLSPCSDLTLDTGPRGRATVTRVGLNEPTLSAPDT